MIRKLATAVVFSLAMVSGVAIAQATDFNASPMNSGPPKLPGIPVVDQVMSVGNAVTSPIVQPILAPGGGEAAPMAAPMMKHHHHHHHHHHMMMK